MHTDPDTRPNEPAPADPAAQARQLIAQALAVATVVADRHGALENDMHCLDHLRRGLTYAVGKAQLHTPDGPPADLQAAHLLSTAADQLDRTVRAGRTQEYPEQVDAVLTALTNPDLDAVYPPELVWQGLSAAAGIMTQHGIAIPAGLAPPPDFQAVATQLRNALRAQAPDPLPEDLQQADDLLVDIRCAGEAPLAFLSMVNKLTA